MMSSTTRRSKRNAPADLLLPTAEGVEDSLYEHWVPRICQKRKTNAGRRKVSPTPPKESLTCWTINCDNWRIDQWEDHVPACSHCFLLRSEMPRKPSLQSDSFNQQKAPRQFRCQTLWILRKKNKKSKNVSTPSPNQAATTISPELPSSPAGIWFSKPNDVPPASSPTGLTIFVLQEKPQIRNPTVHEYQITKTYTDEIQFLKSQLVVLKNINKDLLECNCTLQTNTQKLIDANTVLTTSVHSYLLKNCKLKAELKTANEMIDSQNELSTLSLTGEFDNVDFYNLLAETLKHQHFMPPQTHTRMK